jgi:hypothetical protein
MADESQNTRVFMEKEEALQVICAALQGGALKLPFATEFHDHIKKPQEDLKFETFFRGIQYLIDGRNECVTGGDLMDQFMVPAYSDGLYLLTLLAVLTGGISKEAFSDLAKAAADH